MIAIDWLHPCRQSSWALRRAWYCGTALLTSVCDGHALHPTPSHGILVLFSNPKYQAKSQFRSNKKLQLDKYSFLIPTSKLLASVHLERWDLPDLLYIHFMLYMQPWLHNVKILDI